MRTASLITPLLLAHLAASTPAAHAAPLDTLANDATASAATCPTRVNDTPRKLLSCIRSDALWAHLVDLQAISDAHPGADGHGNRDVGTTGYKASVDYVSQLMTAAGYAVTVQPYTFIQQVVVGTPQLAIDGVPEVHEQDFHVARLSGGGTLSAPAALASGTGTACDAQELASFPRGHVALLQRGACRLDVQVAHAQAAGAAAVVLYNVSPVRDAAGKGRDDGAAYPARLVRPATLPVLGVLSYARGDALRTRTLAGHAPVVRVDVRTRAQSGTDWNLIAESPFGDPAHTVVVEGHLDSIYGAGILDNGSGSATILEIALNLAKTPTRNRLRYVWFGGEEVGLLGSAYYTQNLSAAELQKIAFDVDADVTATPNYVYLIADPANASDRNRFPPNVVPGSAPGTQLFKDIFAQAGIPVRSASFGNDGTDSNSFSLVGIPNTGILTEQDCCKSSQEVATWGGAPGNYEGNWPGFDGGCVDRARRWCDNLSNNDPAVMEIASRAVAYVVLQLAGKAF